MLFTRKLLQQLYLQEHRSVAEMARRFRCSSSGVNYWLAHYHIRKRTISEAIYLKHNPKGDPFTYTPPASAGHERLLGLGLGLYWGEGTKANKASVRLGNTDPRLVRAFMAFLVHTFKVKKNDFRFSLQIFNDIDINKALSFWTRSLEVSRLQFTKTTVTKSGSIGTYRQKSQYGVLTLYYHNKKLRDLLMNMLAEVTY